MCRFGTLNLFSVLALTLAMPVPSQAPQGFKLAPTGATSGDQVGVSVALSGDTALVGANGFRKPGSAYVFVRSGTTWIQQAKFTGTDERGDEFGISVALSGDTALVGENESGSAYVFVRNGTTWTQQARLSAAGQYFGVAVALDGDTAIVAAPSFNSSGRAYIFVRNGTTWTQQAKLEEAAGLFGHSVALNGDTALVGASRSNRVYVFVRSGITWTQQDELIANNSKSGDSFGSSVAVSGDTALVGANHSDDAGTESGSAYLFMRSGKTWRQQATLTADDASARDGFGHSVALNGDTVLVGTQFARSAYIFTPRDQGWSQQTKLALGLGGFGSAIALNGDMAILGAWGGSAGSRGSAYIYELALARVNKFGAGCPSTFTVPVLQPASDSLPKTGETLELVLSGLPPNHPASLILGLSNTQWLSMNLPMSLAPDGAPDCSLLVSGDYHARVLNTTGTSTQGVPIPLDPSLAGLHLYFQGVVLDPGANRFGVAVSNGLDIKIGTH